MVNLTTGAAHSFSYPNVVAGWWGSSPCGDVLGVVVQPVNGLGSDVGLYATDSGQALACAQFGSLNVLLEEPYPSRTTISRR